MCIRDRDNNSLKVSEKGHFVFAVGRDHVEPISVTYLKNGSLIRIHQINIIIQDYDIQRIDGLPEQMVTPLDDEIIERIIYENDLIKEKKKINLDLTFFKIVLFNQQKELSVVFLVVKEY